MAKGFKGASVSIVKKRVVRPTGFVLFRSKEPISLSTAQKWCNFMQNTLVYLILFKKKPY